jgi:predicted nucleic acid-binding protein
LDRCIYLDTDATAARLAGEWRYAYRRQGVQLQTSDVLVAATSLQHGAILVTGNVRHYPMPALSILRLYRPDQSNDDV